MQNKFWFFFDKQTTWLCAVQLNWFKYAEVKYIRTTQEKYATQNFA